MAEILEKNNNQQLSTEENPLIIDKTVGSDETMIPAGYEEDRTIQELKDIGCEGEELREVLEDIYIDFEQDDDDDDDVIEKGVCDDDFVF